MVLELQQGKVEGQVQEQHAGLHMDELLGQVRLLGEIQLLGKVVVPVLIQIVFVGSTLFLHVRHFLLKLNQLQMINQIQNLMQHLNIILIQNHRQEKHQRRNQDLVLHLVKHRHQYIQRHFHNH